MGTHVWDRAVVLGGSLGGLFAARVLSEMFAEVLVVDRDELTDVEGYRRSVPHGRHAHGLIARGQHVLEDHFPGLAEELRIAGVVPGDFSHDIQWYFNGKRLATEPTGLVGLPVTRPVLEYHVRKRIQAIPNVTFLERYDILGLVSTPDGRRIVGARIQPHDGAEEVLHADLVVDTTGRGSRTPLWLEELGYPRPDEERVKVNLAYTTRHFQLDHDPFGSYQAIIPVATPNIPRGAFFYRLPQGTNRVELSLTGLLGDHPPTDPDGFLAYVRSLPVPGIYEAVRDAEPIDDAVMFRFPVSVWRHYERLPGFPDGYLVMGDAVCSFNPVYGQGMSVAALESLTLRRHLQDGVLPDPLRYFKDVAKDIKAPWDLSAGADLGYPGVEGRRTPMIRFINAYIARLQAGAVHDPALTTAFMRAAGLIDPPQAILRPSIALRVLRAGRPPANGGSSSQDAAADSTVHTGKA